jgi:hypothetical protein
MVRSADGASRTMQARLRDLSSFETPAARALRIRS